MDFFLVDKSTVRRPRVALRRAGQRTGPRLPRGCGRNCPLDHPLPATPTPPSMPDDAPAWTPTPVAAPVPPQSRGMQNQTAAAKGRSRRRRKHRGGSRPPQLRLGPTRRGELSKLQLDRHKIDQLQLVGELRRLPMSSSTPTSASTPERTPPAEKFNSKPDDSQQLDADDHAAQSARSELQFAQRTA